MNFRTVRHDRLLSIRALAKMANISPQTITGIESGKRHPHPSTMVKLAESLGVAVMDIDEFVEAIRKWKGEP